MGGVPAQILVDCGVIWGQQHLVKTLLSLVWVSKEDPVIFFPWLTTVSSHPGVKEWEGLPLILMLVSSVVSGLSLPLWSVGFLVFQGPSTHMGVMTLS